MNIFVCVLITAKCEKEEINDPMALSVFRDGAKCEIVYGYIYSVVV